MNDISILIGKPLLDRLTELYLRGYTLDNAEKELVRQLVDVQQYEQEDAEGMVHAVRASPGIFGHSNDYWQWIRRMRMTRQSRMGFYRKGGNHADRQERGETVKGEGTDSTEDPDSREEAKGNRD